MTFYKLVFVVLRFLVDLINGRPIVIGEENLPKEAVIIASTHRSILDPIYLGLTTFPKEIAFMAKQSLFDNPILGFIIPKIHAFPINRERPAPKTLRYAVDLVTNQDLHLGIFPTGTRYSTEVKGGTAFIQRLSKADILPISVQPPRSFWEFITRKKAKIAIGEPIKYDPDKKYDKTTLKEIDQLISEQFNQLDYLLDPDYKYIPKEK